ncbi:MAG: hypothetical protein MPL62_12345 [Alphaproteobacteria bacterium]|nr:hypothetical protein [Alphaproteobacteria bacterium]
MKTPRIPLTNLRLSILYKDTLGVDDFECNMSDESMGSYLRRVALYDQNDRRAVTYVWHDDGGLLAGYATVAMDKTFMIENPYAPEAHEYPMIMPDRLARRRGEQYRGAGSHMLDWVVGLARTMSQYVGCAGVILRPNGDGVIKFYLDNGFDRLTDTGSLMFTMLGSVYENPPDPKIKFPPSGT